MKVCGCLNLSKKEGDPREEAPGGVFWMTPVDSSVSRAFSLVFLSLLLSYYPLITNHNNRGQIISTIASL
jgi:hypothetical protein